MTALELIAGVMITVMAIVSVWTLIGVFRYTSIRRGRR